MKLTFKVILSFILLIILVSAANTYSTSYVLKSLQEERLKTAEVIFAKSISRRLFRAVIDKKVNKITAVFFEEKSLREEKIAYILVFDNKGYLLAHTYLSTMPKILIKAHDDHFNQEGYTLKHIENDELSVYDIAVPVMEGIKQVGTIHVGIRSDYVNNIITPTKTASDLSLIITFFIIVVATMIAVPLSRTITNPLLKFKVFAEKVSSGEMETQIDISSKGEIGDLANAFNKMAADLHKAIVSRDQEIAERRKAGAALLEAHEEIEKLNEKLEQRVKDKTGELRTAYGQLFQAEKLASLGQIAAGVAHELNSPLTGLISMIKHYRDDAQKDSDEYIDMALMYEACEYMAGIIRDFNAFSRVSEKEQKEIRITDVIESSLSLIMSQLRLKNLTLIKEYEDVPTIVKGSKTELQQVFLNIIRNAMDSMADNGRLIIEERLSKDKSHVMIGFTDSGSGIKKEEIKSIFEPFVTTKPQGEGTGLGLSVSYAIIKNHRGDIQVESEIGKGTTFTVFIPVFALE